MQEMSLRDTGMAMRLSQSAILRRTMVERQIRTFEVTDPRVLARMLEVSREDFLPEELVPLAYSDHPLRLNPARPGAEGRTLLPPFVLARLIQDAEVSAEDHVLDVAPGTGYSSALLAGLARRVVALESDRSLYEELRSNIAASGLQNVQAALGPLAKGAPAEAPFDVIFINGTVEANLETLFIQLKEGGRLMALRRLPDPAGPARKAVRYEKVKGAMGYRVLFDASAPVLDAFRKVEEFRFF